MSKHMYSVTYNSDVEPFVTFYEGGNPVDTLSGEEAKHFLARRDFALNVVQILCLPLSVVFYTVVGIHNFTEWLLHKFMG